MYNKVLYTCALIETIGRTTKNKRADVVKMIDVNGIKNIYEYSDILHCEPIEKVSSDMVRKYNVSFGTFDNVGVCRYHVPSATNIAKVYARLIKHVSKNSDPIQAIYQVYTSWIDTNISDYNSSFYYQSQDYITFCWETGKII